MGPFGDTIVSLLEGPSSAVRLVRIPHTGQRSWNAGPDLRQSDGVLNENLKRDGTRLLFGLVHLARHLCLQLEKASGLSDRRESRPEVASLLSLRQDSHCSRLEFSDLIEQRVGLGNLHGVVSLTQRPRDVLFLVALQGSRRRTETIRYVTEWLGCDESAFDAGTVWVGADCARAGHASAYGTTAFESRLYGLDDPYRGMDLT